MIKDVSPDLMMKLNTYVEIKLPFSCFYLMGYRAKANRASIVGMNGSTHINMLFLVLMKVLAKEGGWIFIV